MVGSVDAREPDAFNGYLRSPVRQLSARQFPFEYIRGVLYTIIGAWLSNPPIYIYTYMCKVNGSIVHSNRYFPWHIGHKIKDQYVLIGSQLLDPAKRGRTSNSLGCTESFYQRTKNVSIECYDYVASRLWAQQAFTVPKLLGAMSV